MSSTAVSANQIQAQAGPAAATGFFQRPLPVQLILASFFLLTLPMAAILSRGNTGLVQAAYVCLFGTTHFVVTFVLYLRSENLKYFSSDTRNKIRYFGIPILLFAAYWMIGVFRLVATVPLFALAFRAVIRAADFNHLNRQSFGVHQLFKARAGLRAPQQLKSVEMWYFNTLSGLLYCSFLAGGRTTLLPAVDGIKPFSPLVPIAWISMASYILLAAAIVMMAYIVSSLVTAWQAAGKPAGLGDTLAYLAFQTMSAGVSMISLPLYAATLAMHYVEYHVLMFPRCFHSELDESSALDRWFGRLRSSHLKFYAALIGASIFVFSVMAVSVDLMGVNARPDASRYLIFAAVFDGLFVFHYFVETLIWRFGDPFYRKELKLYFAPKA
jgi:hypothetical protein